MEIQKSDKIVDNLYENSNSFSENEQIKTLIDLYNINFLTNNQIHDRYRDKFIEKDWVIFNEFENYIKNLVNITESFPVVYDSEKICLLGRKLLEDRQDGLFPSVVASFVSRNGLKAPILDVIKDKLLLALANNNYINDQPLHNLIVNTLAPGFPHYDPPTLSKGLPDDFHFELESLRGEALKERNDSFKDNHFIIDSISWLKENNIVSSVDIDNNLGVNQAKEEVFLTPESFTFEAFKTGKPKYSLLTPQHKVYASIVVNDLKTLQNICYNTEFLKEIDFSHDNGLAYKLSDKLEVANEENKVKRFLNDFSKARLYQKFHPSENDEADKTEDKIVSKKPKGRGKYFEYLDISGNPYDKNKVQEEWDLELINNFQNTPKMDVLKLYKDFLSSHNLDIFTSTKKDGSNSYFKRVPMYAKDGQLSVKEYVKEYLPKSLKIINSSNSTESKLAQISNLNEEAKRIYHPVDSKFGFSYTRKEIQKIWDELLIDNFFKSPKPMKEHLRLFYLELGITPDALTQSGQVIHRMPFLWKKEHREGNCKFFVSNYVSPLANILYNHEDDLKDHKETILNALPKMKIRTTTEINDTNFRDEIKDFAETSEEYIASKKERAAYTALRENSNSNWKKCK